MRNRTSPPSRGRLDLTHDQLEAIDAELAAAVYDASRRARLQRLGELPAPATNPRSIRLLRRIRARQLGLAIVR